MYFDTMKNGDGDCKGLQGHEHDPTGIKRKAWVREGAAHTDIYIYIYMYIYNTHTHTYIYTIYISPNM